MPTAQKYPEDIEETIYELLTTGQALADGLTVVQITSSLSEKIKTSLDPEIIFGIIRRMGAEGMVETISGGKYKGVKFDPNFTF